MYIKNFTNKDLLFKSDDTAIILKANDVSLIPDGLTTIAELQKMFGQQAVALVATGVATETVEANKVKAVVGKLYIAAPLTDNYDHIRLNVAGGSIKVYGFDGLTIPTAVSQMNCPDENDGVEGVMAFGTVPRYIAFVTASGTPVITLINCKLVEVSSIA